MKLFDHYITVLGENQHDTYTNPFEIVSNNLGLYKISHCIIIKIIY